MTNNDNINYDKLLMNLIDKCSGKKVEDFQLLYPFTTENIAGYINHFNLSNGTLLTVGSSGDQVINGSLFDCRDIVCLDTNSYTRFNVYLKICCLLELNRYDLLKFFYYKCYDNADEFPFDNKVYNKIKATLRLLDYKSYLIWDELFSNFSGLDIRQKIMYFNEFDVKLVTNMNPYLQSDIAYDEARKKIMKTKIEFITGDIEKIKIDRQFDSIWLSNIGSYYSRCFLKEMVDKLEKNLNENGILLICYFYGKEVLKDYELISFLGLQGIKDNDSTKKDYISVYRKSKHWQN